MLHFRDVEKLTGRNEERDWNLHIWYFQVCPFREENGGFHVPRQEGARFPDQLPTGAFPWVELLGPVEGRYRKLVLALEMVHVERFLPPVQGRIPGVR